MFELVYDDTLLLSDLYLYSSVFKLTMDGRRNY